MAEGMAAAAVGAVKRFLLGAGRLQRLLQYAGGCLAVRENEGARCCDEKYGLRQKTRDAECV